MKQHVIPSIVASVIATLVAVGAERATRPPQVTQIVTAPAGPVSPAKAVRLAKTVWPELEQRQIDGLTKGLGTIKQVPVTIFCIDDAKCGDMVLNLDNALESAHWETSLQNSTMVPPGVRASSQDLVDWLNAFAPQLGAVLDVDNKNAGPGEYIAIGARP